MAPTNSLKSISPDLLLSNTSNNLSVITGFFNPVKPMLWANRIWVSRSRVAGVGGGDKIAYLVPHLSSNLPSCANSLEFAVKIIQLYTVNYRYVSIWRVSGLRVLQCVVSCKSRKSSSERYVGSSFASVQILAKQPRSLEGIPLSIDFLAHSLTR